MPILNAIVKWGMTRIHEEILAADIPLDPAATASLEYVLDRGISAIAAYHQMLVASCGSSISRGTK